MRRLGVVDRSPSYGSIWDVSGKPSGPLQAMQKSLLSQGVLAVFTPATLTVLGVRLSSAMRQN